jgi:hypothetical protein
VKLSLTNLNKNVENMAKIPFMPLGVAFTALVFIKLMNNQEHHMQIFCTNFNHNQTSHMEYE